MKMISEIYKRLWWFLCSVTFTNITPVNVLFCWLSADWWSHLWLFFMAAGGFLHQWIPSCHWGSEGIPLRGVRVCGGQRVHGGVQPDWNHWSHQTQLEMSPHHRKSTRHNELSYSCYHTIHGQNCHEWNSCETFTYTGKFTWEFSHEFHRRWFLLVYVSFPIYIWISRYLYHL